MLRRVAVWAVLFWLLEPESVKAELWDFKVGVGPVFGSTFSPSEKDGLGFQGYMELGLTDTLCLSAGGGYARHFIGAGQEYGLANAGIGILYNLDVLVVVPFVSVRAGWLRRWQPEEDGALQGLGLSVSLGFDYLLTETFTVGFAAEYHGLISDLDRFPAYAAFAARLGLRLPY